MTARKITIDVVSDVVCPWCFLGRKRLEQALALAPEVDAEVRWRPYQLDPSLPAQGKDRQAYMREKFGTGSKIDDIHKQLTELGEENDIVFDFEAITRAPNTLDAHRLIHWAAQAGPGKQDKLVAPCSHSISSRDRILAITTCLLMLQPALAWKHQLSPGFCKAMLTRIRSARKLTPPIASVSVGVPCFIIDQKYAVMGAQSAAVLAEAIQQTAEGFEPGIAEDR
jgi:predicted DsbA family dithiol-disulfide isomerase